MLIKKLLCHEFLAVLYNDALEVLTNFLTCEVVSATVVSSLSCYVLNTCCICCIVDLATLCELMNLVISVSNEVAVNDELVTNFKLIL